MKTLLLIISLTAITVMAKGQTKHYKTERDSLISVIKVHEMTEKIIKDMLFNAVIKNDSVICAYNKLLIGINNLQLKSKK